MMDCILCQVGVSATKAIEGGIRKLVIQIPCWNEAEALSTTLAALPRHVAGFTSVEWLVVDDGSTDATVDVARSCGVHHIVRHPTNRGLAVAFMSGLEHALSVGADVIVNTDADNQYEARDIPKLTAPINEGRADFVVGARPIAETEHFSAMKKRLQKLGSWAVRIASKTDVADAPSGFRAMSREVAMRLNVFGGYTYTLETIIQAGLTDMRVTSVAVRTNEDLRPSRLVRSIPNYIKRSVGTIFRVFLIYRPLTLFVWAGLLAIGFGVATGARFLYYFMTGDTGHTQSVVLAALSMILGALLLVVAMIAELISVNRKLSEQILFRIKRLEQLSLAEASRDAAPQSGEVGNRPKP